MKFYLGTLEAIVSLPKTHLAGVPTTIGLEVEVPVVAVAGKSLSVGTQL